MSVSQFNGIIDTMMLAAFLIVFVIGFCTLLIRLDLSEIRDKLPTQPEGKEDGK